MNEESTVPSDQPLNAWAYVELFGHTKTAGLITTRKFGTEEMFQVDFPKGETEFSHSQLFNPKAVFSIRPTTEKWCREFAAYITKQEVPLLPYIPPSPPPTQFAEIDQENE